MIRLEEDAKFLKKTIEEETDHKAEVMTLGNNTISNYYVLVIVENPNSNSVSTKKEEIHKKYYSQGGVLFSTEDGTLPPYTIEKIITELKKLNPINL